MDFRIAMGVRRSDQDWKRKLNRLIAENQPEIDRILTEYGVPLLDEQGNLIRRHEHGALSLRPLRSLLHFCSQRGSGCPAGTGRLSHGRLSRADAGDVAWRDGPVDERGACSLGKA